MDNKNYFSLIKNSEETHVSCLKTVTVKENDVFYTEDKKVQLSHHKKMFVIALNVIHQ